MVLLLLSTHSYDPCLLMGESNLATSGPPASFTVHLAISAVSLVGSLHKSRGDNMVCIWMQLMRCCVCECYKGDIVVMDVFRHQLLQV